MTGRRVAVVGGGVTGLTAAWSLSRGGHEVTCFEASDRVGGKLRPGQFGAGEIEVGADSFLARHGAANELVRQLGLTEQLVEPATGTVWLWRGGQLRRLPEGTVLGAPTDLVALIRSGALTPPGIARAALEPLVRTHPPTGDASLGDLIGARFGKEVVDHLIEPLLGGVYAGDPWRLSARAAAPMIAEAAARGGSLLPGLRAHRRRTAAASGPVFQTLQGGLATITDRLAADLGGAVRRQSSVDAITAADGRWVVTSAGREEAFDQIILTVPAPAAAALVAPLSPAAAVDLAAIEYASVAVITLGYPNSAAGQLPEGSGMLVPRSEGRLVKASTWVARKWPHRAQADLMVLRASVGRINDTRWQELDTDDLIARADAEIRWATGITRPAVEAAVTPWMSSLPQYNVGHQARVERIRRSLPPGLHVAGAAFDGIGISPCIASANAAAHAASH